MHGLRIAVTLFLVLMSLPAMAEKRVALVIGNSAYRHVPPLANPINDATDMAAKLESLGFQVVLGEDLDLTAMRRTVRRFVDGLDRTDIALFYYSGHGLQVNGNNYMVPVDAALSDYNDLDFEALPMNLVLSAMERNATTNLIFLDACRDNPLVANLSRSMGTRSGAVVRGLAKLGSGVGTLIAFATQPGSVAFDGQGRNSPFTTALLHHLGTPGWDITRELVYVRRDVLAATDGKQVPWDNSSLTGDVVLRPGPGSVQQPGPSAGQPPLSNAAVELSYWDSIKGSTDKSFFEAYLKQYPNGVFAELARLKIEAIDRRSNHAQAQTKSAQPPTAGKPGDRSINVAKLEQPDSGSQLQGAHLEPRKPLPLNPFDGTWRITRIAAPHASCGPWRRISNDVFITNGQISGYNLQGTVSKSGNAKMKLTFVDNGKYGSNILTGRIKGSKGSGKFYHVEGGGCYGTIVMSKM